MKKKYLIIAIILSVVFIISLILVIRTIISTKKNGNNKQSTVSLENSYLFASPLQAKADGKEKIRLTVFVLSGQGLGVQNQKIESY